ncbi:hypothetical protein [Pendulispora albinea]|uniref:KARI N-terminal Rossmann domain-containing protein n=1 Tax=Pendulispora albinea TaxID=2741071 RepID=A0ABZ2M8K9_9BACT
MTEPDKKSGAQAHEKTRIAVLGYGTDARDRAVRLRQAGIDVSVSMRPGGLSWVRANADKFAPARADEAVASAQVVVLLVPDEEQPSVYWRSIAPHISPGTLLVVERGHALHVGAIDPRRDVDIVLVTAAPSGDRVGCRVAVYHDATGKALERAIAYARAAFEEAATSLGTTTVTEEFEADLVARETRAGGHDALIAELDQILVRGTHEPDEAKLGYYERLRTAVSARRPADSTPSSGSPGSSRGGPLSSSNVNDPSSGTTKVVAAAASASDLAARYWTHMRGVA